MENKMALEKYRGLLYYLFSKKVNEQAWWRR